MFYNIAGRVIIFIVRLYLTLSSLVNDLAEWAFADYPEDDDQEIVAEIN